jgi:hypothetical protein
MHFGGAIWVCFQQCKCLVDKFFHFCFCIMNAPILDNCFYDIIQFVFVFGRLFEY